MDDTRSRDHRFNSEPVLKSFQTLPEPFPTSEQYGNHHDVHLVDQIGLGKLSNCRGASADPDIFAFRQLASRGLGSNGDGLSAKPCSGAR